MGVNSRHVPGWKIEQIAAGEKVKARRFSYSSQVYLLMLSQFLHLLSLNEIVDVSKIYAAELSRMRGMTPANLNTFSNANRTRDPKVMQTFFWTVYGIYRSQEPDFVKGRHHGRLSRFRLRNIYAIDSTTIQLAYWCIGWAKHRQKKAAVKVHMAANVANRLPHFCVFGRAKDHDSRKEGDDHHGEAPGHGEPRLPPGDPAPTRADAQALELEVRVLRAALHDHVRALDQDPAHEVVARLRHHADLRRFVAHVDAGCGTMFHASSFLFGLFIFAPSR